MSCLLLFLYRSLPHSPPPARGSTTQLSFSLSLTSLLYLTLISESIFDDDLNLQLPCPPFTTPKLLYRNRVKNSPMSPISKTSSLPTALSPSVASIPSSPIRSIKLHFQSRSSPSRFVFWPLIIRSIFLWQTREKCEEYVSWSDQFQSCKTQRFSASVRSRGSDLLWAWNSQARNQGSMQSLF